jgi:4-diphosphocytidyl-2-C-methyl-D-erythritol kinase
MRIDAFAKLTLSLRVTGVRADGLHELDAVMVSVSEPHDTLELERASQRSLEVVGPFAAGTPANETNLAWRAAAACGASVAIRLHKRIPAGAGLGGGSADAAAVLVALGADPVIAPSLGADVPFCMRGGAARVRGVGELLEGLEMPPRTVLVATPRFGCSTADVYRAWDELGGPHAEVNGLGANDLETAAHRVEPRLVAFKHAVEAAARAPVILAGSGSSYAAVFDDRAEAERARKRVTDTIDGSVWLATAPA